MIKINAIGYLVTFVVYFIWGDSSRFWGGFNICTQLYFYATLWHIVLMSKPLSFVDRRLVYNVIFVTMLRLSYTFCCINAPYEMVVLATKCFTVIVTCYICFLFLYLIYLHCLIHLFNKITKVFFNGRSNQWGDI